MTSDASFSVSAPAVPPRLRHAFGGIWRLTYPRMFTASHGLIIAGLLVFLGLVAAAMLRHNPSGYLNWTVDFYLTFVVPITAFINAAGAIRDDLKSSSVDYVMTRPVPRVAFLGFKYVAHVIGTQLEFLLGTALLLGLGVALKVPGSLAALPLFVTAQVLVIFAASALGFLAGVVTSRYVIVGLSYGGIVETGIGQIPTQINRLSITHQVRDLLHATPPFAPQADGLGSPLSLPGLIVLLLGYTLIALMIAGVIFRFREFGGSNES